MSVDTTVPLDAALELARRGMAVLPLWPVNDDGRCSCGDPDCRHAGKHPLGRLVPRGLHEATTDHTSISQWWATWPDAGIAVALEPSELLIVGPDAPEWLAEFERRGLPATAVARTGGGDGHQHYYYRRPQGCPIKRVCRSHEYDILTGGYVVLPPTLHRSGKRYEWIVPLDAFETLPDAPAWAVAILANTERRRDGQDVPAFDAGMALDGGAIYQERRTQLPASIRCLIEEGHVALPETAGDRSAADMKVCVALVRTGCSNEDIRAIFQVYPIGSAGKYAERGDGYLSTTIANARSYVSETREIEGEPLGTTADRRLPAEKGASTDRRDFDKLIELGREADLFHTPTHEPYAAVRIDDHLQVFDLRDSPFRMWLRGQSYRRWNLVPSRDLVERVIEHLTAIALFDGSAMPVHLRSAEHEGKIYVDLGNDKRDVVVVGPEGWRVISSLDSPVRFRRSLTVRSLPVPVPGGGLAALHRHVNVGHTDLPLLVGWLVMALHPSGPYPILALSGEQGSAKSTAAKMLRHLTDPSLVPTRSVPAGEDELRVAAFHNWLLVIDNLSHIPQWLSDVLCRLVTEGTFTARTLYTTMSETAVKARRPVVLTAIADVLTSSDLIDRSVLVRLQSLSGRWRSETEIWRAFEADAPSIFGGLLDAMSTALRNLASTTSPTQVRMSDFASWVAAAEPSLPWEPGTFLRVYQRNRNEATSAALEASPVAQALLSFMKDKSEWETTADGLRIDLTRQLEDNGDYATTRSSQWPRTGKAMSNALKRIEPNLRDEGIMMEQPRRTSYRRPIRFTWINSTPGPEPTRDGQHQGDVGDDDAMTIGAFVAPV